MATSDRTPDETAVEYKVREAVAVFDTYDELVTVIEELEGVGFDRAQMNLMTSHKIAEQKLGHRIENVQELEDEPRVPVGTWVDRHEMAEGKTALTAGLAYIGSMAAVGAVVATGGGMAVAIAAAIAAGGTTGAVGAWLARTLGNRRAHEIEEQLKEGGLLLWVEIRRPEQEQKVLEILNRHSSRDVHVHEVTRTWGAEQVRMRGWQPDPFLAP